MNSNKSEPTIDRNAIRAAIQQEYAVVANDPDHGFHFHTGRPLLTEILGYDVTITWRKAVFDGAPQAGSAAHFGAVGITFSARKPVDEGEWHAALATLTCEIP